MNVHCKRHTAVTQVIDKTHGPLIAKTSFLTNVLNLRTTKQLLKLFLQNNVKSHIKLQEYS